MLPGSRDDALVVLTRPQGRNQVLAQQLAQAGVPTVHLPALQVLMAPDALTHWVAPQQFDLVVFVSGFAVHCYMQCWQQQQAGQAWPAHTYAATVGVSSAQALRQYPQVPASHILHPDAQSAQDSEALWQVLQSHNVAPVQRAQIVSAAQGRDWLWQRLTDQGGAVERYPVYVREPAQWAEPAAAPLVAACKGCGPVICLATSSESVDAIADNVRRLGVPNFYRRCQFLAIHPRVASRLQWQAQCAGVTAPAITLCAPDDLSIVAGVQQLLER